MAVEIFTETLVIVHCYKCGIAFGMQKEFNERCHNDSDISFYCPKGHSQIYTSNKVAKLKSEVEHMEARLNSKDKTIRSLEYQRRAQKANTTKLKNRIKNGICPCCKRSFSNLKRHMEGKHPEYNKRKGSITTFKSGTTHTRNKYESK